MESVKNSQCGQVEESCGPSQELVGALVLQGGFVPGYIGLDPADHKVVFCHHSNLTRLLFNFTFGFQKNSTLI